MSDLFDQTVLCSECGKKMSKIVLVKNGFKIRALRCEKCQKMIHHPADIEEYKKYIQLRQKPFAVKLRMVGNSYTVSIPREIVDFHREQEQVHREEQVHQHMQQRFVKMQNEMIKMFLEDVGRISLCFPGSEEPNEQQQAQERELSKKIKIKDEEDEQ
jgi:transcription elongation factor Elf1